MADAAEEAVGWAKCQFWLSIFGIGGLIATIAYIHRTFNLSRKTAARQLRAYIAVMDFEAIFGEGSLCRLKIKNVGLSSARDVVVIIQWQPFPVDTLPPDNFPEAYENDALQASFEGGTPSQYFLAPSQEKVFDAVIDHRSIEGWQKTLTRHWNMYNFGRVFYRDVYDQPWRQFFCVQWGPYVGDAVAQFTP